MIRSTCSADRHLCNLTSCNGDDQDYDVDVDDDDDDDNDGDDLDDQV